MRYPGPKWNLSSQTSSPSSRCSPKFQRLTRRRRTKMRAFATASRKRENHFEYVSVSLIVMPNIVSYSIRPCQATQRCKPGPSHARRNGHANSIATCQRPIPSRGSDVLVAYSNHLKFHSTPTPSRYTFSHLFNQLPTAKPSPPMTISLQTK